MTTRRKSSRSLIIIASILSYALDDGPISGPQVVLDDLSPEQHGQEPGEDAQDEPDHHGAEEIKCIDAQEELSCLVEQGSCRVEERSLQKSGMQGINIYSIAARFIEIEREKQEAIDKYAKKF